MYLDLTQRSLVRLGLQNLNASPSRTRLLALMDDTSFWADEAIDDDLTPTLRSTMRAALNTLEQPAQRLLTMLSEVDARAEALWNSVPF